MNYALVHALISHELSGTNTSLKYFIHDFMDEKHQKEHLEEQTTGSSGRRGTAPPTEPGFSQGFFSILSPMEFSFLVAVASGLLSYMMCDLLCMTMMFSLFTKKLSIVHKATLMVQDKKIK